MSQPTSPDVPGSRPVLATASPARPAATSGFAVLDVETTGLSPRRDRVVSIAMVLTDPWGRIEHEWSTLVNPRGPVGATHIHGITEEDVTNAPTFERLVPDILAMLRRRALVAHNATFDLGFLSNELARAGWGWPADTPSLCTLRESFHFQPQLDRRRLADCCWAAGVPLVDAHSALGDARAAAQLFSTFARSAPEAPIARGYDVLLTRAGTTAWPTDPGQSLPHATPAPVGGGNLSERARRNIAGAAVPRPRLLESFTLSDALDDGVAPATLPYLELLAEALEDGELSEHERSALGDLVDQYGLQPAEVVAAHRGLVRALAREAVEDGRVTAAEKNELRTTAALLDVDERQVGGLLTGQEEERMRVLSANLAPLPASWSLGEPLRVGQRVAFTGCERAGRDALEKRTADAGLRVTTAVSRRTAVLVSDGTVDGAKATAARQLGIRVVTPSDYATLLRHRQPALIAPPRATVPPRAPATATTQTGVSVTTDSAGLRSSHSPAAVRTWALANGFAVGTRGRLPADVWDAHSAAHQGDRAAR